MRYWSILVKVGKILVMLYKKFKLYGTGIQWPQIVRAQLAGGRFPLASDRP